MKWSWTFEVIPDLPQRILPSKSLFLNKKELSYHPFFWYRRSTEIPITFPPLRVGSFSLSLFYDGNHSQQWTVPLLSRAHNYMSSFVFSTISSFKQFYLGISVFVSEYCTYHLVLFLSTIWPRYSRGSFHFRVVYGWSIKSNQKP